MRSKEYLREIRAIEGLSRAVLQKIDVEGTTAVFSLLTDKTYRAAEVEAAERATQKYVPEGFTARVRVVKSVPDAEAVRAYLVDLLKREYPAVAAFTSPEEISVEMNDGLGVFRIGTVAEKRSEGVIAALSEELARRFCGSFTGDFYKVNKDMGAIEEVAAPVEYVVASRYFSIEDYAPIDGANPKRAIYIADLTKESTTVTVCGEITYLEERLTKKEKPYFSLTITDGSAQMRLSYFTRKTTLEKIRSLKVGDFICVTGDNEIYNNQLSFRAKQIDYGRPPKGFVPEARPSRPVPAQYKVVFPEPASDYVQADLFGGASLPEEFIGGEFVVFDLETTGTNNSQSDRMDHITEIGAVRISGGKIVEKFSSFVACPVKLSEEIVNLTGITDDMLRGAPPVGDVLADFYKFSYGCALVGHNVQFDNKFIRHYGELEGFVFDQKTYDTLSLSQELLRLSHYKLNIVADHFGFNFNHHRAFDDAFVTAKIFIELIRKKGSLPK